MKAAFQFFFLATYLVSSYATTQHRVAFIVDYVLHTGTCGGEQAFEEPTRVKPNYTRFAEAKKVASEIGCEIAVIGVSGPLVNVSDLVVTTPSAVSHVFVDPTRPRAPPVL